MDEPSLTERASSRSASSTEGLSAAAAADVVTVAKGGALQILGQACHRSMSFFLNAVAFRVLGPAGFGLYRVVAQTVAIAAQLGLLGFNYAALRFITLARVRGDAGAVRGTARTALKGAALVSVTTAAALFVAAEPLADAFAGSSAQQERTAFLFRVGVLYIPFFALVQVLRYCTQAYKTMVPSVMVGNIIQPTLQFIVGVSLLGAGFAVTGAVTSLVISMGVAALAGAYYFRRILSEEEKTARPHAEPAKMIRFALPQAGSTLLNLQNLGPGVILLGALSSTGEVGLFAAALALQGPAGVFQAGTVSIWAPVVADLHDRGEMQRLGALYETITRWIATFALPISAAMIIKAELFARFFGGDQAVDAAPVVAILAVSNIFYTCTGASSYVLSMTGHPVINFLDTFGAVVLYVVLGTLIAPEHGAVGMAWVDAAVMAVLTLGRVVQAKILVGIQPFGRSFLKPVTATLIGSLTLIAWTRLLPGALWLEIGGITFAVLVYLLVLRVLGMNAEERHVWELLKGRLKRRRRE